MYYPLNGSPFNIVIAGRAARTSTHNRPSRIRRLEAVLLCDRIEIGRANISTHVESPALKGVKSWVLRGALLARHAPHEPNPFPQVNTHDNTAAAAHRGVRRDSGLSPLSWDTPSLACHSLLGLLCEVVWVSDLECHRRMGTELWHGDASGPGLCPRCPLCRDPTDGFPVCGP